jgi:hypothetical protein
MGYALHLRRRDRYLSTKLPGQSCRDKHQFANDCQRIRVARLSERSDVFNQIRRSRVGGIHSINCQTASKRSMLSLWLERFLCSFVMSRRAPTLSDEQPRLELPGAGAGQGDGRRDSFEGTDGD